ncbi:MAG: hypothetical protein AAB385_10435 [Planctomycetota bacterium]
MSAVAPLDPQLNCDAILDTNLRAISAMDPNTADLFRNAIPPDSVRPAIGRDGSPTFSWADDTGRTHWLGRTTMPSISVPAQVDAFQPGLGNVLLHPLGHGLELRRLLDRLLPHQAVFVTDPNAWAMRLALSLVDVHIDIDVGRLCLFTGDDAWSSLEHFLVTNPGYVVPDRILSRPWFDHACVNNLSNRMSAITTSVHQKRATAPPATTPVDLLILSNVSSNDLFDRAADIRDAAVALSWSCDVLIPDSPRRADSRFIQSHIDARSPQSIVYLDTMPARLPYRFPPGPKIILAGGDTVIDATEKHAPDSYLCVESSVRQRDAEQAGWPHDHVVLIPPAASLKWAAHKAPPGRAVVLIGDRLDPSPEKAGLNLQSHLHLWKKVRDLLSAPDRPNDAATLLDRAQRAIGIRLESDHVIDGLLERIHTHLMPHAAYEAALNALASVGIEFDVWGACWYPDARLPETRIKPFPRDSLAPLSEIGLAVFIWPQPNSEYRILNFMAAGIPVAVSNHFKWQPPLDTSLATTFTSPAELVAVTKSNLADPRTFVDRAERTRNHVIAQHTWIARLRGLVGCLRLSPTATL